MKRKVVKKRKPQSNPVTLANLWAMALAHRDRLSQIELKIDHLGEQIKVLGGKVAELSATPLSMVREMEKMIKRLDTWTFDKGAQIDNVFPNVVAQFNAIAEAVNKISAYTKALDEAGNGMRWLTRKRIKALTNLDNHNVEEILKLKHRLSRMEQKL